MAAYASLVSVMQIINQLQHHPFPPISIDEQQVESLTEIVTFLQKFLEDSTAESGPLEMRIADAAYEAEDVIESYIVDEIQLRRRRSTSSSSIDERQVESLTAFLQQLLERSTAESDPLETRIADAAYEAEEVIESSIVDAIQLRRRRSTSSSHHPSPPISIDEQQVESPTEIVTLLQQFLERSTAESDPLETQIADAAYEAEDVIESSIVDAIQLRRRRSTSWSWCSCFINCFSGYNMEAASHHEELRSQNEFCRDLQKVIEEMDSIKRTVMEMMTEKSSAVQAHHHQQQQRNISRSSSVVGKNMMVGFDDVFVQLLEKLTDGPSSREVIPITGMGGIGKTTLARNVFEHACIKDRFDICAWVTVSQQYDTKEIICKILSRESVNLSVEDLGVELHKYLYGRRYLIIMDDMWSIKVWEKVESFFGDCNNGSRIIVTTRQSHLTSQLTQSSYAIDMKFLDEFSSWNLFSKIVFGEESDVPLDLEKIGKKIVEKCRGLPLSIVVIGGFLAKSQHTQKYWEDIEQKFNSIVNSENDEYCLKILKLSYNQLPAYLKPCFLYMGSFKEDKRIHVSTLIKLWVSEGFLKPENGKTLETIGKEFLKDLIDRNLVLIDDLGSIGSIKYCKMHDLLRDLCLKEAENERFYYVIGQHGAQGIHNRRRMFYPQTSSNEVFKSPSHIRSFTSQHHKVRLSPNFRLLRIFNASYSNMFSLAVERDLPEYRLKEVIDELVNSRYVAINAYRWKTELPSSVSFLWNLNTLRIEAFNGVIVAPIEIWKMSQLRHVEFFFDGLYLPDPPSDGSTMILDNLQTLKGIVNFKCGEEVVKRIPNIMKLKIQYKDFTEIGRHDGDYYGLNNLQCLCKLESFTFNRLSRSDDEFVQSLAFPHSLKRLKLIDHCSFGWEEMLQKIGSLPLFQKLDLRSGSFTTHKWKTIEGRFPSLKFLEVSNCRGLKQWMIEDSSHFPCLEHLHLSELRELEEIPSEIGEIPTLQSIGLGGCSDSVVKSAKKIVEEQEELQGGEEQLSFHVRVFIYEKKQEGLQSLASRNFKVDVALALVD